MDQLRSVPEIADHIEEQVSELALQRDLWKKAADLALKHNGELLLERDEALGECETLRLQVRDLNRDLDQANAELERRDVDENG